MAEKTFRGLIEQIVTKQTIDDADWEIFLYAATGAGYRITKTEELPNNPEQQLEDFEFIGNGGIVSLSPREYQIVQQVVKGKPNKVIGNELGITESTVKVHLKRILQKCGVQNRTQLAVLGTTHQEQARQTNVIHLMQS